MSKFDKKGLPYVSSIWSRNKKCWRVISKDNGMIRVHRCSAATGRTFGIEECLESASSFRDNNYEYVGHAVL